MVGRPAKSETTPPVADPRWAEWSAPLLGFLEDPRTWDDLFDWADRQKPKMGPNRLRNCLCWLEGQGLVLGEEDDGGAIIWKKTEWLLALSDELAEIADGHVPEAGGQEGSGGDPDPELDDDAVDGQG